MDKWTADISDWLPYVSVILPIVIGIFYKSSLTKRVKAVGMLVVTAVVALINQITTSSGIVDQEMLQTWGFTLAITIASYYGVWKPLGLGNVAPDKGIGPEVPDFDGGYYDGYPAPEDFPRHGE